MNKQSPNLELISSQSSNSSEGGEGGNGAERRRLPRLNLTSEQFRLKQTGKIFSVTDLSNRGMALRIIEQGDFLLFPVATVFEGILNLRGEKFALTGKVRHLGPEAVGCEFEPLSPAVQAALDRFLDPAELGRELKPIPSSESGTLWYHGSSGTDLLLRRGSDGQYHRMTLYVLGSYIQWTEEGGLATGSARSSDETMETRGILRFETMLLNEDAAVDKGKLGVAKTLILSSNLAEDFKKWCVRKLGD